MNNALDKTDFKILRILQEDGRITNLQLSAEIGLSPAPTLERVRKLERKGFIKSYHAHVDFENLGLGVQTYMLVTLSRHTDNAIANFIEQINKRFRAVGMNRIRRFIYLNKRRSGGNELS